MAYVPQSDVEQPWNEEPHSWSGLHRSLEQRLGTSQGIDNTLVQRMITISENKEKSGQSYPSSEDQVHRVLNEAINDVDSSD